MLRKKKTDCVSGSERYERTKNNRLMLKCTCISCGITKTKFVSHKTKKGTGVGETVNKKIGDKIPGFSQIQDLIGYISPSTKKETLDRYWSGDIAKRAFNNKTGLFSKKFWSHPDPKKQKPSCNYIERENGKLINHYCS